jgi:hypothetical protein
MIRLRLSPDDLQRPRFAYSPLAESLHGLQSGQVRILHRGWFDQTRTRLRRVDTQLPRALVPTPRPHVPSFLLSGAVDQLAEVGPAGAHRGVEHFADCLRIRGDGATHLDGAHPDTFTSAH